VSLLWPLQSWSEQWWASILDPTIRIQAYNKEGQDVCDYDLFFSAGLHWIKSAVRHDSPLQRILIYEAFIPPKVTATSNIVNYTPLPSKSPIELTISLPPSLVHIWCRRTDLHRRQPICLQRVGCLAHINAQTTMWEYEITMVEIHWEKLLDSGNPRIKFIHHQGIVTRLRMHHFQALHSSTTLPHSTWHQVHNQAQLQPKNIEVMGHCGKHIISPKEVMVDLTCSLLSNWLDRGRHVQARLVGLRHCLQTIQSFCQNLPPLLHTDNFPVHLDVIPLAIEPSNLNQLRNRTGKMLKGPQTWPHNQRFLKTNSMLIKRTMITRTWAGLKVKPQSAWSKRNSP